MRLFPLIILFSITQLFSQIGEKHHKSLPNEYFNFISQRSTNDFTSLIGEWELKTQTSWKNIQIPVQFSAQKSIVIKKSFILPEKYSNVENTLHIIGINDNAIIKLNGQIIYSYNLNGAPLKLQLDAAKLYFGRENTLEIEINHLRDFSQTIPRESIKFEAQSYGGIAEIFLEHHVQKTKLHFVKMQNNSVFAINSEFKKDSARFFAHEYTATILDLKLDTIRSMRRFYRRNLQQNDTIRIPFRLKRREQFTLPIMYYIHIQGKQWVSGKLRTLNSELKLVYKSNLPKTYKLISKVEIAADRSPFLSMERMEDDVRKIALAGFNGIYFPYHFPHPYYSFLEKKYAVKIFAGLPTYSLTDKALEREDSKAYIANLLKNNANPFSYLSTNKRVIEGIRSFSDLNIILIPKSIAEFKNYKGYLNKNNEESQAKHFVDALKNNSSYLIPFFTDYLSYHPSVEQYKLSKAHIEQTGLLTIDRKEKKAFRAIKAIQLDEEEVILNPGDIEVQEVYTFLVIGMILFAIFVIGFKQATRLSDNLKRTFFHAHGFFTDTRDRRILYMGQSFFLGFMSLFIVSNLLSSYLYFYGSSETLHVIFMYLTPDNFKALLLQTLANPISTFVFSVISIIFVVIVLYIIFKIVSLFGKRKINFRQTMTVIIWGFAPVLFLIPVSMFAFNSLQSGHYVSIMNYFVYLIIIWSLMRLVNGLRVVIDTTRIKVYLYSLIIFLFLLSIDWLFLSLTHEFGDYMPYFAKIIGIN